MAFDLSTARPVGEKKGFDISTAKPIQAAPTPPEAAPLQPPTPFQEKPIPERLQSIAGGVTNLATGALGTIAGGVTGLATTALTGDPAAGAGVAERVQESLTSGFQGGQELTLEVIQGVMDVAREKAGPDFVEVAGAGVDLVKAADQEILETFGPEVATLVRTAVVGAPEVFAGRGLLRSAPKGSIRTPFTQTSATKQKITEQIKAGSTDIEPSRFVLEDGKLSKDPVISEAKKQGFDEGVLADVKQATTETRANLREMTRIMEKGKQNKRFALVNRPGDVAGDALLGRFRVIKSANRKAGKEIDAVANKLRGKEVDSRFAVDEFLDDLDSMGIKIDNNLKPDFRGSDIEDLAVPEAAIRRIMARMAKGTGTPDAFELHRMKRFIDEGVTMGSQGDGLAGKTERVLKDLRRNLDNTLDDNFPEYNRVNTTYSETIGAIDALQDVAGKKMNLTGKNADKAAGTLMRRLMSNAQSRVPLMDSIELIEQTARKFGGKKGVFKDDLFSQALYVDELDRVFKPVARTSLQGQVGQAVDRLAQQPTAAGLISEGTKKGLEFVRGINDEAAFAAIKELLKE